jgi:ribonuclease BN (tRNA processing enzyme)
MVSLLVDDVLAIDAGCLASSLSFEDQQKIRAILLTHSHYDHVRDIPAIALNFFSLEKTIEIYSTKNARNAIASNLLNGEIYPDFTRLPNKKPTVRFSNVAMYRQQKVEGYNVVGIPVNHGGVAIGYEITSPGGRKIFFAADTGLGLSDCWEHVSPDMLFIEVTFPNRLKRLARNSKHLTPEMLEKELTGFIQTKGYVPAVVVVHMDPKLEDEIRSEVDQISKKLNIPISLAYEGMQLTLQ